MKLSSALKKANEISSRIKSVNGIIATPLHRYEAVKIQRVWLFGSAAKGKLNPNDVDILIEMKEVGFRSINYSNRRKSINFFVDKDYQRRYGLAFPKPSGPTALKWIRNKKHNVSLHWTAIDRVDPDVKIMIYPRNDLAQHFG